MDQFVHETGFCIFNIEGQKVILVWKNDRVHVISFLFTL